MPGAILRRPLRGQKINGIIRTYPLYLRDPRSKRSKYRASKIPSCRLSALCNLIGGLVFHSGTYCAKMRRNLAKSLSFQGRSAEGAVVLRDALSICLADKTCSDDELSLTYEGLVFEYAVQLKDIKLAVLVINEMVAIRERFGDETEFHALLRRCVDTLRASGFSKEADDLSGMIANQRK